MHVFCNGRGFHGALCGGGTYRYRRCADSDSLGSGFYGCDFLFNLEPDQIIFQHLRGDFQSDADIFSLDRDEGASSDALGLSGWEWNILTNDDLGFLIICRENLWSREDVRVREAHQQMHKRAYVDSVQNRYSPTRASRSYPKYGLGDGGQIFRRAI